MVTVLKLFTLHMFIPCWSMVRLFCHNFISNIFLIEKVQNTVLDVQSYDTCGKLADLLFLFKLINQKLPDKATHSISPNMELTMDIHPLLVYYIKL